MLQKIVEILFPYHETRPWAPTQVICTIHYLKVPENVCQILERYFRNKMLLHDTLEEEKSYYTIFWVPQGSILSHHTTVYGESIEKVELTAAHSIGKDLDLDLDEIDVA